MEPARLGKRFHAGHVLSATKPLGVKPRSGGSSRSLGIGNPEKDSAPTTGEVQRDHLSPSQTRIVPGDATSPVPHSNACCLWEHERCRPPSGTAGFGPGTTDGARYQEEPHQKTCTTEGLFSAPNPVFTAPPTTSQPQPNLAEQGIRKDAVYSLRTKTERSVPSREENSVESQVDQISPRCAHTPRPPRPGPTRR